MPRHHLLFAGLLVIAVLPLTAPEAGDQDAALVLTGIVRVATAPDGATTLVSVDVARATELPDGVVDHVFRVQHEPGAIVPVYRGPGTVTSRRTSLTVAGNGTGVWTFVLKGRPSPLVTGGPSVYPVVGLSRTWGTAVEQALHDLGVPPGAVLSDPACDSCAAGGGTETYCSIGCGEEGGCWASCAEGYFACCNCPGSCRCCRR
jgi:hypothetical protein